MFASIMCRNTPFPSPFRLTSGHRSVGSARLRMLRYRASVECGGLLEDQKTYICIIDGWMVPDHASLPVRARGLHTYPTRALASYSLKCLPSTCAMCSAQYRLHPYLPVVYVHMYPSLPPWPGPLSTELGRRAGEHITAYIYAY